MRKGQKKTDIVKVQITVCSQTRGNSVSKVSYNVDPKSVHISYSRDFTPVYTDGFDEPVDFFPSSARLKISARTST